MSISPPQAISTDLIPEFDAIVAGTGSTGIHALRRLRDELGLSVRAYGIVDAIDAPLEQSPSRIVSAVYDDANNRWDIEAADGTRARARFVIVAASSQARGRSVATMGIRGRDGLALDSTWEHEPRAYLGIAIRHFPNLFLVTAQTIPSAGHQIDFLSDCIAYMFDRRLDYVDVTLGAERRWMARTDDATERGRPDRNIFATVAANGYEGFSFDRPVAFADPMLFLGLLDRSPARAAA